MAIFRKMWRKLMTLLLQTNVYVTVLLEIVDLLSYHSFFYFIESHKPKKIWYKNNIHLAKIVWIQETIIHLWSELLMKNWAVGTFTDTANNHITNKGTKSLFARFRLQFNHVTLLSEVKVFHIVSVHKNKKKNLIPK